MTMPSLAASDTVARAERLLQQRDLHAAEQTFRIAASQGEDADRCAGGLWVTHMLQGDFEAAWQQSDCLRRRNAPDPHRFWQGEPLAGTRVIVRCLHGFGDAVQMLRYLPLLRERCARIILEVPPRMLEIAACFPGADDIVTWGEHALTEPPAWDVQVEIMELPYLLRTRVDELPIATQYLKLPETVCSHVRSVMGKGTHPRVGVVWSTGEWNRTRAIPFDYVKQLTGERGIEFWNLQGGHEHDEWQALTPSHDLRDGADVGHGILQLACLVEQMDLVITPDTLAAHLAGALGTPAWILLQHAADWRWMHGRADSPWYPSLRLFRQTKQGCWDTVIRAVQMELKPWKTTI